jgi:hypothetical protein
MQKTRLGWLFILITVCNECVVMTVAIVMTLRDFGNCDIIFKTALDSLVIFGGDFPNTIHIYTPVITVVT